MKERTKAHPDWKLTPFVSLVEIQAFPEQLLEIQDQNKASPEDPFSWSILPRSKHFLSPSIDECIHQWKEQISRSTNTMLTQSEINATDDWFHTVLWNIEQAVCHKSCHKSPVLQLSARTYIIKSGVNCRAVDIFSHMNKSALLTRPDYPNLIQGFLHVEVWQVACATRFHCTQGGRCRKLLRQAPPQVKHLFFQWHAWIGPTEPKMGHPKITLRTQTEGQRSVVHRVDGPSWKSVSQNPLWPKHISFNHVYLLLKRCAIPWKSRVGSSFWPRSFSNPWKPIDDYGSHLNILDEVQDRVTIEFSICCDCRIAYAMRHSTRAAHAACYFHANLSTLMSETCFGHNYTWDLSAASWPQRLKLSKLPVRSVLCIGTLCGFLVVVSHWFWRAVWQTKTGIVFSHGQKVW